MATARLTDIMHSGDLFIFQTRHGNWVLGAASEVNDNGDISCPARHADTGFESMFFTTLKQALVAADAMGLIRTWKIGYHRWKLEKKAA